MYIRSMGARKVALGSRDLEIASNEVDIDR